MGLNKKQIDSVDGFAIEDLSDAIDSDQGNTAWRTGGGSIHPNKVIVTLETQLSDVANAGKNLHVQADIILTSNLVLPSNIKLVDDGGSVDIGTFNIQGNNTTLIFDEEKLFIDLSKGTFSGTFNMPYTFYITNVGAKGEGGLILKDASMTLGSTTVQTGSNYFDDSVIGQTFTVIGAGGVPDSGESQGYVHTSTCVGFTAANQIELADASITATTNESIIYGTDDYTAIDNALRLRNTSSGELVITRGKTFYTSSVLTNSAVQTRPSGWVAGDGTDGIKIRVAGNIQLLAHDIQKTRMLTFWRTENSSIIGEGGMLLGDYKTFSGIPIYTAENGKAEDNHCIVSHSLANRGLITRNKIAGFYGDGWYAQADSQFMNQIDGLNAVDTSTDSGIAVGFIDDAGVIDAGNTDYIYSDTFLTLEGGQFDNITERGLQRWVHLTGGSFGAWDGMSKPHFWLAYYDVNDNFLWKTDKLFWFSRVRIPEESYVKCRVMVYNPDTYGGNKDDIAINLRPSLLGENWEFSYNDVGHCGRECISNPPIRSHIFGNYGHDINGLQAGPCAFVNIEDGGRINQFYWIYNNRIENCWIGISLKNTENVWIYNNMIGSNKKDLTAAPTGEFQSGLSIGTGRNTYAYSNTMINVLDGVDRQTKYYNNKKYGGSLYFTANEAEVYDNEFWDVNFVHNTSSSGNRSNTRTKIRDNKILITEKIDGYLFSEDDNAIDFWNNEIIYNSVGNWQPNASPSDNNIFIGDNNKNRMFLRSNMTEDLGGSWKGNLIKGGKPALAIRDYVSGEAAFPITDYDGDIIHTSMEFKEGLPRDFTLKNMEIYGWVEFDMQQYTGALLNPTTINFVNTKILIKESDYNWTNNGSNILTTAEKNHNLYAEKTSFIVENDFIGSKFFNWNHLGSSLLVDCYFEAGQIGYTMNLNDTSDFGANLGNVILINPRFGNGFNVLERLGKDKVLWTISSPFLEIYADNAAAIAGGIPVGYMYRTATGDTKVVF